MAPLLSLAIAAMTAAPVRLPPAIIGKAYTAGPLVPASGQACPPYGVTMQLAGGMLPPGIELSPAGYFSGEPADPGTYHFIVRSVSNCGSAEQKFVMDVGGSPVLNVFPASLDVEAVPGKAPEPAFVRVSSNQASLAYTMEASKGADWLDARQRLGRTPAAGAALTGDIIEVRVDPSRLSPGTHRGYLKVSAWRSANAPVIPVTVTVPGPPAPPPSPAAHAVPHPPSHAPAPDPHAAPAVADPHAHEPPAVAHPPKAAAPKPVMKAAAPTGQAPVRKFAASRPKITKPVPLAAKAAAPAAHGAPPAPKSDAHAAKPDAHAKKDDGHGAKPDAHAKKDDGHGAKPDAHAKKDDGHGAKPDAHAKKDDGHGAKPDAHAKKDDGHGAKPDAHAKAAPKKDAHGDEKKEDKGHTQTASAHGAKPAAKH